MYPSLYSTEPNNPLLNQTPVSNDTSGAAGLNPVPIDPSAQSDTATNPNAVPIDAANTSTPMSAELAAHRAFKYKFGTPNLPKSFDDLYYSLTNGGDSSEREQAAAQTNQEQSADKASTISSIAQGPLTPDKQIQLAQLLNKSTSADPSSVFEENFAKQFMRGLYQAQAALPDTFMDDAREQIPNFTDDKVAQGTGLIAKSQFFLKELQDTQTGDYANQSYTSFLLDQAKTLVPGFTSLKMRSNLPGVNFFSGTLGENLEQQATALFNMPFDQMKTYVQEQKKNMNPSMYMQWLAAMYGQTSTDATLNSVLEGLDLAALPGTVASALKIPSALGRVGKAITTADNVLGAVKGMVRATTAPEITKATVAEAAGDIKTAAIQKATSNLILRQTGNFVDSTREAIENFPIALRTDVADIKTAPGAFSQELIRRIEDGAARTTDGLMDILKDRQQVQMLPEEALQKIADKIREQDYAGIRNANLNLTIEHLPVTNTYEVRAIVGKPNGELFRHKEIAENYAHNNGLSDHIATATSQGIGWYLSVQKPLNQFSDIVRDATIDADLWKSPHSIVDRFSPLAWIRTAEDTMAQAQRSNRRVATYSPNVLYELMKPSFDVIKKVGQHLGSTSILDKETGQMVSISNNQIRKDWNRIVSMSRDMKDADGNTGYFFKSPEDLQTAYLQNMKRLPSEKEVEAYFEWKKTFEVDRVLRNVAVRRNMERLGAKQYQITTTGADGAVKTKWFNGVYRNKLPGGTDDALLNLDAEHGQHGEYLLGRTNPGENAALNARLKNGHQVIEIYDPESRPLGGYGGVKNTKYRYVMASNVEAKPLDWEQVPRRGGGHFAYEFDNYLKQGNVREENIGGRTIHHYEGDNTVAALFNRGEGLKLVKPLNQIRELLLAEKAGDPTALAKAKALAKATMPRDAQEIMDWFKGYPKEDGTFQPPRLNLTEEFRVVPRDKYIADMDDRLQRKYPDSFRDGTRQGSLARQFQVQFTGERDVDHLFTPRDVGTRAAPVFNLEPAQMLDPVPSLQKGLNKIINSTWMDDYKFFSVQQWLQEAAPFMKTRNPNEVWHSPYWHFNNPEFKAGAQKLDTLMENGEIAPGTSNWSAMMANRFKIQQLLGTPNVMNSFIHAGTQFLADTAYAKGGPAGLKITPPWMMAWLRDPFSFVRAATFHEKLGLFNVPQFFVQNQTYTNIWGIAGARYAAPGTYGALLHQWSRLNQSEEILDHLDGLATKLPGKARWKPGEWREANAELLKTGFNKVSGEVIVRDDPLTQHFVTSGFKKFLDWGTTFFNEGEQNVRFGAWYTAYKEFRDQIKPLGKISNEDRQWILDRADLLNNNMSRASSSLLHTGPMALTSQFMSYQIRTAELLMSSRINNVQRGRLVLYNAMLYGIPMATAMMPLGDDIPGFPFATLIRKKMYENGYVVGDSWWKSALDLGIPAALSAMASGKTTDFETRMRTGTWQNFGSRYGNQGVEFNGDEPWYKFILGASSSTLFNFADALSPFQRFLAYRMGGGEPFKIKAEHFLKPLEDVSAWKAGRRLLVALNTGNWINSNDQVVDNHISPLRATVQTLLGTQDQLAADTHFFREIEKDNQANYKWAEDHFKDQYRKHLIAASQKNDGQANDFYNNGEAYLAAVGYPRDRLPKLRADLDREYKPLVESVPESFYTRNLPTPSKTLLSPLVGNKDPANTAGNAWERYMKLRMEKNQP